MSIFMILSKEGAIMIQKSLKKCTQEQLVYLSKYFVLSMSMWSESSAQQLIKLDEFTAWILRQGVGNKSLLLCWVTAANQEYDINFTEDQERNGISYGDIQFMMLYKISMFFVSKYKEVLQRSLNLIADVIENTLNNGTFSDSVGDTDHIQLALENDNEFQEMKFSIESSQIDSFLSSAIENCPKFLRVLASFRSVDKNIVRIILYCSEDSSTIELYRSRRHYRHSVSSTSTEIQDFCSIEDDDIKCKLLSQISTNHSLIRIKKNQIIADIVIQGCFILPSLATKEFCDLSDVVTDVTLRQEITTLLSSIFSELSSFDFDLL